MNFHEDPINNEAEYKGNVKIAIAVPGPQSTKVPHPDRFVHEIAAGLPFEIFNVILPI